MITLAKQIMSVCIKFFLDDLFFSVDWFFRDLRLKEHHSGRTLWNQRKTRRKCGYSGKTTLRRSAVKASGSLLRMPRRVRRMTRRWSVTTGKYRTSAGSLKMEKVYPVMANSLGFECSTTLSFPKGEPDFTCVDTLQVPAKPVCQNVFGPPVSGNQQDLWPAGCGPDLAVYVRWRPAVWPTSLFLSNDAAHACGSWPSGAGYTSQICTAVVWDPFRDCYWRVRE